MQKKTAYSATAVFVRIFAAVVLLLYSKKKVETRAILNFFFIYLSEKK